jgi:phage-related protein
VAASNKPRVAKVYWEGTSYEVLTSWPKSIRTDFGRSLREMQEGRPARLDVRPMQSIGKGVFELKDSDDDKWYRLIYLARIDDVIYVLDCFEKDTTKTEKKDLKRASAQLSNVQERLREERKNAKRKTSK